MADLSLRQSQVPTEAYQDLPDLDHHATNYALQSHDADKAGKHYDLRINIGGKAVSFAVPKDLPRTSNDKRLAIRQPDHVTDYMGWSGNIPKGQYGAGSVSLADKQDVVAKTNKDRVYLSIPSGVNKGNYVFIRQDGDNWLVTRRPDMARDWHPKEHYKDFSKAKPDDKYLETEKLDGAHFIVHLGPSGISFTSQRKSVNGDYIGREDNVPHLRDIKVPEEFQGITLRGELHHPAGFNILSGILNSHPAKAVAKQQELGPVQFAPFDIVSVKGKKIDLTPDEKYQVIKGLETAFNNPNIKMPETKLPEESSDDFYAKIVARGGEGTILQNLRTGERLKRKARLDYDLHIAGFTPGEGKYKGLGIGAIILKDRNGNEVGNVGSGIDDETRKDMQLNPQKYIGRLAKVTSMPVLKNKVRSPVYLGLTTDKDVADSLNDEKIVKTSANNYVVIKKAQNEVNELPQTLPKIKSMIGGNIIYIMKAESLLEKELGLMFVEHLPLNEGMLFCYDKPQKLSFWMKNTKIPLDIIFMSSDLIVTEYIENMKPGYNRPDDTLEKYQSKFDAQYALELPSGAIKKLRIVTGQKLILGK